LICVDAAEVYAALLVPRRDGTLALRPDAMMRGSQAHGVFRRANELLAELVRANGFPGGDVPFICECVDSDCFGRVTMSLEKFDQLRAAGGFALEHGHERCNAVEGLR
jgi:hypothetical protein